MTALISYRTAPPKGYTATLPDGTRTDYSTLYQAVLGSHRLGATVVRVGSIPWLPEGALLSRE
jgi:hypothetical protein